jgi:hypothetical protein
VLVGAPALAGEEAGVGEMVSLVDGLEVGFADGVPPVTALPAQEAADVHYLGPVPVATQDRPLSMPARRGEGGWAPVPNPSTVRWSVSSMLAGRSVSL